MKDFILAYNIGDRRYLNITNRCTNNCVFCIRKSELGVGYNLWLDREPTAAEVVEALGKLDETNEIVFCGYGEPLIRLDLVKEVAAHIKQSCRIPIRINTNGHADLIHGRGSALELKGLVDRVNISLNAHDDKKYIEICRPAFGKATYQSLIGFAESCAGVIPEISLSVVEWPGVDVEKCREIARRMGAEFRLRKRGS